MPITAADIAPTAAPPAPAEAPAPAAAPAAPSVASPDIQGSDNIPEAVLNVPAFGALLRGSPPAMSDKGSRDQPELALLRQKENVKPLYEAGFGFFRAKSGEQIIFNSRFTDEKELLAADAAGKLDLLAPPFIEVKNFFNQATGKGAAPVADPTAAPDAAAAPAPDAPAAPDVAQGAPAAPPAPQSAQRSITNARLRNLALSEPTSGAAPGGGRILNNILKPTV